MPPSYPSVPLSTTSALNNPETALAKVANDFHVSESQFSPHLTGPLSSIQPGWPLLPYNTLHLLTSETLYSLGSLQMLEHHGLGIELYFPHFLLSIANWFFYSIHTILNTIYLSRMAKCIPPVPLLL